MNKCTKLQEQNLMLSNVGYGLHAILMAVEASTSPKGVFTLPFNL